MASWRKDKIFKKSWLVSNPDFLKKIDLISIGHIFLTHKDVVNLLKVSGIQILVVHAQYTFLTHDDDIYLGPNLLGFLDKIVDYGPMVEALILMFLGDLVNTLS